MLDHPSEWKDHGSHEAVPPIHQRDPLNVTGILRPLNPVVRYNVLVQALLALFSFEQSPSLLNVKEKKKKKSLVAWLMGAH